MPILTLISLLLPVSLTFDIKLSRLEVTKYPRPTDERDYGSRNRTLFTIPVSIGTPPQTIPLIVDTSIQNIILHDPQCESYYGNTRFHYNHSTSLVKQNQSKESNGYEFMRVRDSINLTDDSRSLVNQSIDIVTNFGESQRIGRRYGNGFFGLNPEVDLLDRMRCAGYIEKLGFTVFFTGDGSSEVSRSGLDPVISWSSWNLSKYSTSTKEDFDYVPVVSETEWKIRVDSVKFGDLELVGSNPYATLDTKDGRFFIPKKIYNTGFKSLTEKLIGNTGHKHNCADYNVDLPDIVITIGAISISIPKEVYVHKSNDTCCHKIDEDAQESFRFGVPFFQSAYVFFDLYNRRVGIAPSRNVNIIHKESEPWNLITVTVGVVVVVNGVVWAVYRCCRKKKQEAKPDAKEKQEAKPDAKEKQEANPDAKEKQEAKPDAKEKLIPKGNEKQLAGSE